MSAGERSVVRVDTLPSEVKDRLVWAAIGVAIAHGNCDIDASEQYAVDALDSLHAAMEEAERYAVPRGSAGAHSLRSVPRRS